MLATSFNDATIRWATLGFLTLAVMGWALPDWILTNVMFGMARGMAVLGLMILWRTGLVSFGHALYFGLGAYAVALLEKYVGLTDVFLKLVGAVLLASAVGFVLGFVLRNYRAIFFAMLSLAFSMVLYGILVKIEALGDWVDERTRSFSR